MCFFQFNKRNILFTKATNNSRETNISGISLPILLRPSKSILMSYASLLIWRLHPHNVVISKNIQACLPQQLSFSQHVLWQCCNYLGILSSMAEILLFNSVFHDGVTPVSISTLKPLLGVIRVFPLKPQASPILSVCI